MPNGSESRCTCLTAQMMRFGVGRYAWGLLSYARVQGAPRIFGRGQGSQENEGK
jgi:hypothetical protein